MNDFKIETRVCRGSDPRHLRLTMDGLLDRRMWGATPCIKNRPRRKVRPTQHEAGQTNRRSILWANWDGRRDRMENPKIKQIAQINPSADRSPPDDIFVTPLPAARASPHKRQFRMPGRAAMTPQEQALVDELFARLASVENAPRDPEAERLIADGLRRRPMPSMRWCRPPSSRTRRSSAPMRGWRKCRRSSAAASKNSSREASSTVCATPCSAGASRAARYRACAHRRRKSRRWLRRPMGLSRLSAANANRRRLRLWRIVSRHGGLDRGRRDRRRAADGRDSLDVRPSRRFRRDDPERVRALRRQSAAGRKRSASDSDMAREAGINDIDRGAGSDRQSVADIAADRQQDLETTADAATCGDQQHWRWPTMAISAGTTATLRECGCAKASAKRRRPRYSAADGAEAALTG